MARGAEGDAGSYQDALPYGYLVIIHQNQAGVDISPLPYGDRGAHRQGQRLVHPDILPHAPEHLSHQRISLLNLAGPGHIEFIHQISCLSCSVMCPYLLLSCRTCFLYLRASPVSRRPPSHQASDISPPTPLRRATSVISICAAKRASPIPLMLSLPKFIRFFLLPV